MIPGRLIKRQREEVSRLVTLVDAMARRLDNKDFDAAVPTLEPTLDMVRNAVANLRHQLGELELIVEMEHSENRW